MLSTRNARRTIADSDTLRATSPSKDKETDKYKAQQGQQKKSQIDIISQTCHSEETKQGNCSGHKDGRKRRGQNTCRSHLILSSHHQHHNSKKQYTVGRTGRKVSRRNGRCLIEMAFRRCFADVSTMYVDRSLLMEKRPPRLRDLTEGEMQRR